MAAERDGVEQLQNDILGLRDWLADNPMRGGVGREREEIVTREDIFRMADICSRRGLKQSEVMAQMAVASRC